jgi:hypothetical protein
LFRSRFIVPILESNDAIVLGTIGSRQAIDVLGVFVKGIVTVFEADIAYGHKGNEQARDQTQQVEAREKSIS